MVTEITSDGPITGPYWVTGQHPNRARRRQAVRDAEPRHAVRLREIDDQAAVRRARTGEQQAAISQPERGKFECVESATMDVEKDHLDVLQNIEFAIVSVHQQQPALVDFDVDAALSALMAHYQAASCGPRGAAGQA